MIIPATSDPAKPSHDFFGLIDGAIGCLPASTPTAYPPTSEATTHSMNVSTRPTPSGATVSIATKEQNSGTYTAVNSPAETSRR